VNVTIHVDAHRHDVCQIVYFMFSDLAFKHSRLSLLTSLSKVALHGSNL